MTQEATSTRAVEFASPRKRTVRNADRSYRLRAVDLLENAAGALGRSVDEFSPWGDLPWSPEVLSNVAGQCVERARLTRCGDETAARSLYQLAIDMQMLAMEVQEEQLADRGHRLAGAADGLARLRSVATTQALVETVCEEIAKRCDFGRVVISRVESSSWMPTRGYFASEDASWFTDWVDTGIPLNGNTPEARLLTERAPALVYDTASTDVHHEIIVEDGQSSSYVVAPLISADTVVGLLHADHFPTSRQVDDADRDLLATFADGFVRLHSRLAQVEQLEAQRARARNALAVIGDLDDGGWSGPTRVVSRPDLVADLTTRELEVLDMIVQGATNRDIGRRLVIAEDTVKSHVKQILRKLGVANRAQAIACAAGTAERLGLAPKG